MPEDGSALPRFGIAPKGNSSGPPLEYTNYHVILDAESEAMPLWILSSRRVLQERDNAYGGRNPNLPIFGDLMHLEGTLGYDAACILDSVHRLGPDGRPSYHEAC